MAFATKYKMSFKDEGDTQWHVNFQEDGWGGATTVFTPGVDPLNIRWNGQDKYDTIMGSIADIQMVYESAVDSLYTETSQTIKVVVVKVSAVVWQGYLCPGEYYKNFNQSKFYVTLTASDGLGELKDIKFTDDSDDPYFYQQTEIIAIANILQKTGLDITIYEYVDIYADGMNEADGPLELTYMYPEKFWDEVSDESEDCYAVLNAILKKYGARLLQWDTLWQIVRPNACSLDTVRWRSYTYQGAPSGTGTMDGFTTLSDESMVYIHADAELNKLPGAGSTEITLNPPMRENLLKNGSFDDHTWNGATPYYWTNSSASIGHAVDADVLDIGSNGDSDNQPTQYLYTTFNTYKTKSARLTLQWKAVWSASPPAKATIMIVVKCNGQYFLTDGTWTTTAPPTSTGWQYNILPDKSTMTAFEELTIDLTPPYASGTSYGEPAVWEVRLYEFWNEDGVSTNYWSIKSARFEAEYGEAVTPTKIFTYDGPNTISNILKDEITSGDSYLGIAAYDDMFYHTSTAVGDGDLTAVWYIRGDAPTVGTPIPIAELLAKQYTEGFWRSMDVINARFRGGGSLKMIEGIQDPNFIDGYGFNKTFFPLNVDLDVANVTWGGSWVECAPVYTDEGMEWDSHDCGGDAVITGNSIEINSWTAGSTGDFAYYDSYTSVAGETIRLVVSAVADGASSLPELRINNVNQSIAWGTNYVTYRAASAGANTIELYGYITSTYNCTITIDTYSITGV